MKLKSLIIIAVSLLTFSACGPTQEEQAQSMAANYLKGVLFHYDSYEPLQTKVDSLFVSLSSDAETVKLTLEMLKLAQSAQEYADIIERAESSMEIWSSNGYSSAFSKGKYRRAKEERDYNQELLDKTEDRLEAEAPLKIGDFEGWKVYHKFKSLNGAATVDLLGEYVFFCDENFNVKSAYSKEEYDAITKIMAIISSSGNISEMIAKMQEEIY